MPRGALAIAPSAWPPRRRSLTLLEGKPGGVENERIAKKDDLSGAGISNPARKALKADLALAVEVRNIAISIA